MATTKVLRLVFKNQNGSNFSLTLPNPRPDVTPEEVAAVMDTIIARNIFHTSGGDLVTKFDIRIIETNTSDLYDPQG